MGVTKTHLALDPQRHLERYMPVPESGCWIWMGAGERYGELRHKNKRYRAHRFMWEMTYGPIPEGMDVCHKCDVTFCINPEHLFVGTRQDNMDDMVRKGRHNSGKLPEITKNRWAKWRKERGLPPEWRWKKKSRKCL